MLLAVARGVHVLHGVHPFRIRVWLAALQVAALVRRPLGRLHPRLGCLAAQARVADSLVLQRQPLAMLIDTSLFPMADLATWTLGLLCQRERRRTSKISLKRLLYFARYGPSTHCRVSARAQYFGFFTTFVGYLLHSLLSFLPCVLHAQSRDQVGVARFDGEPLRTKM